MAVDCDGAGRFTEQSSDHLKIQQDTANGNGWKKGKKRQGEEGRGEQCGWYHAAQQAVVSVCHQYTNSLNPCGVCDKGMGKESTEGGESPGGRRL